MSLYNGKFVFVNNKGAPNYVSGFAIKVNGALEHLPGSPFATGGDANSTGWYANNPIAMAKAKKLLFAANSASNTVTVFKLNSNSGELTAIGAPVASGGTMGLGASLAVDADENFLFVANDAGGISVFAIAADGSLTQVAGSPSTFDTTSFAFISRTLAAGRSRRVFWGSLPRISEWA